MKCPNCGFENESRFCPECGAPMGVPAEIPEKSMSEPGLEPELETRLAPELEPAPAMGPKRGFGVFWRKNKRNKVLVIIAALVLICIVRSIIGGIGSSDLEDKETYDWPTNDMAQMLPEPEGTITYISTTDGESLSADVECSVDQYRAFIDGCKEKGFDKNQDVSQYEESYDYSAENKDAFTLSADYYDGTLSIYLNAPEETAETTKETKAKKKETKAEDEGEVTADFKETMDDYEEFMNDYVDFMKKYENSDDTASMLVDYGKMMAKYSEFTEKIDAIDEDELSSSDYAYYMEVTGRVNQKLAELY
ncbi:MAG: zinc ribbon domain-containing protein [Firmicutes bacterium]|nr:zinc ribbon domain-containing protein [Bacillota bacterium]